MISWTLISHGMVIKWTHKCRGMLQLSLGPPECVVTRVLGAELFALRLAYWEYEKLRLDSLSSGGSCETVLFKVLLHVKANSLIFLLPCRLWWRWIENTMYPYVHLPMRIPLSKWPGGVINVFMNAIISGKSVLEQLYPLLTCMLMHVKTSLSSCLRPRMVGKSHPESWMWEADLVTVSFTHSSG